jgi:hypothetical protein
MYIADKDQAEMALPFTCNPLTAKVDARAVPAPNRMLMLRRKNHLTPTTLVQVTEHS